MTRLYRLELDSIGLDVLPCDSTINHGSGAGSICWCTGICECPTEATSQFDCNPRYLEPSGVRLLINRPVFVSNESRFNAGSLGL